MNLCFNVLNHTMLTQVLHELRLGNLQRCKALGLGEEDIYLLQSLPPTTLSRLAHATVPWVEVKIDSRDGHQGRRTFMLHVVEEESLEQRILGHFVSEAIA